VSARRTNALLWFGVLGGGIAWALQFVANLAFGWAQCNQPGRWLLPVRAWQIGLASAAAVVGVAAFAVSFALFRRTRSLVDGELRGLGGEPPPARISFLSVIGMLVNFLALAIILLDGVGAPLLRVCQQS
jgi:hypothetical protein